MIEYKPDGVSMKTVLDFVAGSVQYIGFVIIAVLGGTANYIGRVKRGDIKRFSFAELLGEWLISGFTALLTAYACVEYSVSWHITAFLCGITGHMGGRAIFMFEVIVLRRFNPLKQDNKDKE